jgi:hypothetical protein
MRSTGVRLVTRPTAGRYPRPRSTVTPWTRWPPYTAVVLRGGKAARLGGQAKPQLAVGGRPILAAVLDAVADADRRIVVGPPQPVPSDVLLVREQPPGGGPVAAVRAGLADVSTDVVVVLAGDLPFLTATWSPAADAPDRRRRPGRRRLRARPVPAGRLADRGPADRHGHRDRPSSLRRVLSPLASAPRRPRSGRASRRPGGLRHPRGPRAGPRDRRRPPPPPAPTPPPSRAAPPRAAGAEPVPALPGAPRARLSGYVPVASPEEDGCAPAEPPRP